MNERIIPKIILRLYRFLTNPYDIMRSWFLQRLFSKYIDAIMIIQRN